MRKWLILTGLAVVAAVVSLGCFWQFGSSKAQLRLPGTVEVQEVRLASKVGGRVADVMVREGQIVKPGQELVRFDMPEMEAQREQMQAKLVAAEADLRKARNGPRYPELDEARAAAEAAEARLSRLVKGWRDEEKRQARADLETAEADLVQAQKEFARIESLLGKAGGTVSQTEVDLARASRSRHQGRVNSAKARVDMMNEGSRKEDIAEAEAEHRKLKARHDLLKLGTREEEVALAEATVAEIKARVKEIDVQLREAVVRAPELAVVEVLSVRKGDVLPPNQPIGRVLRADDLWVKVYVPETELAKVRLNEVVEVTVDGYPGRKFEGVVEQIATASEFTPRNVQSVDERRHQVFAIKVRVADPGGIFKSGMAAEVIMPLREAK